MYASFGNQLANMSKFLIAFLFLFLILPSLVVGRVDEDEADNLAANYIRTVFFVIVVGYFLVLTKLFEFVTLFVIILYLLYRKIFSEAKLLGKRSEESTGLFILRFLDKQVNVVKMTTLRVKNVIKIITKPTTLLHCNMDKVVFTLLTFIVLLLSAYIRFQDAVTHAALPLSDSYITLDWLKGVERRQLFYEPGGGVYPRGLSIFMATIHKFSFIDALYVVKYTGPLNGLLIVVSILYVVYKLTRSKYAALAVSALYGIGAGLLGSEIERQSATNSQEFALVFFLPTIFFTYKYLKERRQRDCLTAISGLTIMGLIHAIAYSFGVIAVSINIFILFIKGPIKNFKDYLKLIAGGVFSAVISVVPVIAGRLEGIGLHGSSVDFLTDTGNIMLKELSVTDYLTLATLLLFGIYLIILARKMKKAAYPLVPLFLLILSVFIIYYAGGFLTKSTVLDARTREIWALCAALSLGIGFGLMMPRIETRTVGKICSIGIYLICFVMILKLVGVKPLEPYKMEWDSGVEQYLKISNQYNPKSWTMVAEELQYAMITGTGFIEYTENFTKNYSATNPFTDTDTWLNIGEHIFIYQQKNIFEVNKSNTIYDIEKFKYEKMKIDGEAMEQWLKLFTASGGSYSIYYEDQNIRIVYIYNKAYEALEKSKLWEE